MARPIPLELPPRDPREELRSRLAEAPVEHAEALLDSYELLQQLHDRGVFQLLRGGLGASDKLVETAVEAARSDESVRAIRNAIILGKMLGSILTCCKALPWPWAKPWGVTKRRRLSRPD